MIDQELLDLLIALAKCRPVSQNIACVNAAHDTLKAFLDSKGIWNVTEIINERKVLYASPTKEKEPDYLFNAHIDVVPAVNEDQFTPRQEGKRLYGRGCGDDLGHVMSLVKLLMDVAGKPVSMGVMFSADEEIGGRTTSGLLDLGYKAKKCVVIADGGNPKIVTAEKGLLSVKVTAVGKGGHAAMPWALDNPFEKLFAAYTRLKASWDHPTAQMQWKDSMTVTMLNAGKVHNQVPDSAAMLLNIRYTADERREIILEKLRSAGLEVEIFEECPPVVSDRNDPHLQRLLKIASEVRKTPCSFGELNGATDARHLKRLGVPIAIMGVVTGGAHSANEFVELDSIAPLTEILKRFMLEE